MSHKVYDHVNDEHYEVTTEEDVIEEEPEEEEVFECDECGETFDTERGLNVHKSQVHAEEAEEEE